MPAGRPRKFDYNDALDKAVLVFWEKGYEGASMPDLTAAMNMNRPSIYAAFGNKEELFCKALERYTEKTLEHVREALAKESIKDAVAAFLCGAVNKLSCKDSPKGCMAVQGALACSDGAKIVQDYAILRREKIVQVLQDRLEKGIRDGQLPKKTDTKDLARFYIAVVQGLAIQSASGVECDSLRGVANRALDALPSV